MAQYQLIEPDLSFIRRLRKAGGDSLKQCYQCATCSVTCELSPEGRPFPRKEMLWAQWGLKDRLVADPDLFLCYQCNDCSKRCPRGARPGDVLAAVRAEVYRTHAFPSFMGAALANPRALPALLMLPVVVLLALLVIQHDGLANLAALFDAPQVVYSHFLKHGILEALFLSGNALVFLFAMVGFVGFYRRLRANDKDVPAESFVTAAIATLREVITHGRFGNCGPNRPRRTEHQLVLFGFCGAMATAGLALLYMLVWQALHPAQHFTGLTTDNPIKWLGVASGVAMTSGGLAMVLRRTREPDEVGARGYADNLFLWMVLLVAITGLATWVLRLANVPSLAYPVYFVHLTVVFFLLWYMPYSKFAHMAYRGVALVWAHQTGRLKARR